MPSAGNDLAGDIEDAGHRKGKRRSTKEKHDKGDERRKRDKGGEKKDDRMPYKRNQLTADDLTNWEFDLKTSLRHLSIDFSNASRRDPVLGPLANTLSQISAAYYGGMYITDLFTPPNSSANSSDQSESDDSADSGSGDSSGSPHGRYYPPT
jgi:hypothetical protein